MLGQPGTQQSIWSLVASGGFAMYPLLVCSLLSWGVILERLWSFRTLSHDLRLFHNEALHALLRGDRQTVINLCHRYPDLPSSRILAIAVERLSSKDKRIQSKWQEAIERHRQLVNQSLRRGLWLLGTIGAASPFIGLFGTVLGILRSFQQMARAGSGGFAVVAAGISESLIATAAGIVVAVIAVMAYNAFQTRVGSLILMIKLHAEEFAEILDAEFQSGHSPYSGTGT